MMHISNKNISLKSPLLLCLISCIIGCTSVDSDTANPFLTDHIPHEVPIAFHTELIPKAALIHRAILSNDLDRYYFTVSDRNFTDFQIMVSKKENGVWTRPTTAFFNSRYNDHGMSFSPDGETLVFSSTRPVGFSGVPETWHIWMSRRNNSKWSTPEYVEIPNLKTKLVSHPTLTPDGTLYFHASDLDYANMAIYYSRWERGKYQDAVEVKFEGLNADGYCTPYISADGQHLIFAAINQGLQLYICKKEGADQWSKPSPLPDLINRNGQGNPYLTPDANYLFFAAENEDEQSWEVNWVNTAAFIH